LSSPWLQEGGVDLSTSSAETALRSEYVLIGRSNLKVRFYGKLANLFGSEREISVDTTCTVAELRRQLAADYPQGAESLLNGRVRACVGDAIVPDGYAISKDDVLDLLAPVSGG
jgi:molybdopterin converting factor small subunit